MTDEQLREVGLALNEIGIENIMNIILIKNNATNGEVIKAAFPQTKTREENMDFINFTLDGIVGATVEKNWWMTKYKREQE